MTRIFTAILISLIAAGNASAQHSSTREERKAVAEGNAAYRAKDYATALTFYKLAERANPSSLVARFNQGLAQMQVANAMDATKQKEKERKLEEARKAFESVAANYTSDAMLASRANYNMGNMSFLAEDYQAAIDFYKQALRLNPADDKARKNLRLAQMKLPKNNKDNKQNNKNDQDKKDKDKQDQKNQPKPKPQNDKDKNENQQSEQNQQSRQQQQPQQGGMSQQAADRILKHSSDKEKQTMKKAMYGNERVSPSSRRKW